MRRGKFESLSGNDDTRPMATFAVRCSVYMHSFVACTRMPFELSVFLLLHQLSVAIISMCQSYSNSRNRGALASTDFHTRNEKMTIDQAVPMRGKY